nr:Kv channel interacting protein 4 [Hymenolepis microstoma]
MEPETSHSYAVLTFNAFDRSSRGHITFSDFIQTLSTLIHGTREEVLNWVFDLYDYDKDGYITRQELVVLIRAVNDLLGPSHNFKELVENVDTKANWMLNKFDIDRDGKIGRREFVSVCLRDEIILESLTAFGGSF